MDQCQRSGLVEPMSSNSDGQTSPDICRAAPRAPQPWRPTRLEAAVTGQLSAIERDAMNAHAEALAAELTSDGYPPWLARRVGLHDAVTLRLMAAAHSKMSPPYLKLALRHQKHLLDMLELGRRITAPTGAVVNISATNVGVVAGNGADR